MSESTAPYNQVLIKCIHAEMMELTVWQPKMVTDGQTDGETDRKWEWAFVKSVVIHLVDFILHHWSL